MMILTSGITMLQTETGKTWVRWEAGSGFFMLTQDSKSTVPQRLPIDPAAIDALVAVWAEWKARLPSDAFAPNAALGTPSPPASRDGPARFNSASSPPAPSPRSTTSGSGAPSSPIAKAKPVESKPADPKDLFS